MQKTYELFKILVSVSGYIKTVISKKEMEIGDIFTELMIHTFIYLD